MPQRGFTLLEMMLVLLLIGVFLTFFRKSGLWPLGTAAYLTVRLLMLARRTDTVQ